MENLALYEKFRAVPEEAKRKIKGGRINGFTDINPMWRIKMLTEEFGPCGAGWYYKPVKEWIEQVGNEYAAFVDIELYVKYGDKWSMPISGSGELAQLLKKVVYSFLMNATRWLQQMLYQLHVNSWELGQMFILSRTKLNITRMNLMKKMMTGK
ncbi:MAG: hypothetical protein QM793_15005 [Muricomes sp.]